MNLDFLKDKDLLLLLQNKIRGGFSSVMGDRFVESNKKNKSCKSTLIIYMDGQLVNTFLQAHLKNYNFQKSLNYNK